MNDKPQLKYHTHKFDSFDSLVKQAINGEANHKLSENQRHSKYLNFEFTGTHSWEDCLSIISNGWEAGRNNVYKYTAEYKKLWEQFFPVMDNSDSMKASSEGGSILNMDAYNSGDPNDMFEFFKDENNPILQRGGKLQRIIVNGVCSAAVNADIIYHYGSLIAALVNSMELSGFQVELWVCWKMWDQDRVMLYYTRIKAFDDRLDLDKLAFSLAHSSMLRRIIFALMEQGPDEYVDLFILQFWAGYGRPGDLTSDEILLFGLENGGPNLPLGNMYFKFLHGNYTVDQLAAQCTCVVKDHYREINFNNPDNEFNRAEIGFNLPEKYKRN